MLPFQLYFHKKSIILGGSSREQNENYRISTNNFSPIDY